MFKKKRNKTCELCYLWHWPNFMSFIVNDYLMFWCSLIKKFNLLFVFIGPQRKVNATVTVRSFITEWIIVLSFFISVCSVFYKKKKLSFNREKNIVIHCIVLIYNFLYNLKKMTILLNYHFHFPVWFLMQMSIQFDSWGQ